WLLDLETRAVRLVTKGSMGDFRPAWSPDGEWIAFSSHRDDAIVNFAPLPATSVWMVRNSGNELSRLTTNNVAAGNPSWSPDGGHVVYYQTAVTGIFAVLGSTSRFALARARNAPAPRLQIVSFDTRTGQTQTLADGPDAKWSPHWLASGEIVYASGTGVERAKGAPGGRGEYGSPDWSADGTKMVFHRETDSTWPPFQTKPVQTKASLDNGFHLIRTGIFPSYSPSGKKLVCNNGIAGIAHNGILIINADGSNRRVLFDDPMRSAVAPVWSPRGDRIAFALGQFFPMVPGREQVTSQHALIASDGSGLRILTAAGDHAGFPSWSPDARRLVYRSGGAQGRGLRILDLGTNRVAELTNGGHNDNFPAWSPKGDRIA